MRVACTLKGLTSSAFLCALVLLLVACGTDPAGTPLAIAGGGTPGAPGTLPVAAVGASSLARVSATGGSETGYVWDVAAGSLPPGMTLASEGTASAVIGGTATVAGTYAFTLGVTDSAGNRVVQDFSLSVADAQVAADGPSAAASTTANTTLTFTVDLSAALPNAVTVDYATADGTATAGADYLPVAGTLTFPAGVTSQAVGVTVLPNTAGEPAESFGLTLSNAGGAVLTVVQDATAIIKPDPASQPTTVPCDFNGDGLRDVLVGAWAHQGSDGAAYVFYGSATPPATRDTASADVTFLSADLDAHFGASVAFGDVNGDGFADAIVGAPYFQQRKGRAYVFFGSASASPTIDTTAADFVVEGLFVGDFLGTDVAAGDVNGDGIDDVIVRRPPGVSIDPVYIFYGSPTLGGVADGNSADVTIFNLDTSAFGSAFAIGDLNADGLSDLIVGSWLESTTSSAQAGKVYVFFGSSALPATMVAATDAAVIFEGEASGSGFGVSVASADINGDGLDDVVAGAQRGSPGTVYAFFSTGLASPTPIGAVSADMVLTGTGGDFGAAVAAGDINGDSLSDVIVGAKTLNGVGPVSGALFAFFGTTTPVAIDVANADLRLDATSGDHLGEAVAVSDIDNDGLLDVLVGAPTAGGGAVYTVFGSSTLGGSLGIGAADVTFTGAAGDRFGSSIAGPCK